MSRKLSQADVERLIAAPSAEGRAAIVQSLATTYSDGTLNENERRQAEAIFETLARDAEVRVRATLARQVETMPDLPRDLALELARDVEEVALPVLEHAAMLTDEDLVEIVQVGHDGKQQAIARRQEVGASVAEAICEHGTEAAVATLMVNEGAEISAGALDRAIDRFPESEQVHDGMIHRSQLPVEVAERLVAVVSERLLEKLAARADLPERVAFDVVERARERATLGLAGDATDTRRLVRQLYLGGRLTPSIVLRAILTGDMAFFETALAVLAGVPLENARVLIHEGGLLGLKALYERAQLPSERFHAAKVATSIIAATAFEGAKGQDVRCQRRIIERVLTHLDGLEEEDVAYLMRRLDKLEQAAAA